ncbi:hypothetical protein [Streptomyces sp. NPDC005303]|uniref:hypothetical protein n=1 Tax=Streptomyces sp. NPDC005303 TaxID=3155713 RepID=UPI0033A0398D
MPQREVGVAVAEAEPDQVFLAWQGSRRSPLVEAFVEDLAEESVSSGPPSP